MKKSILKLTALTISLVITALAFSACGGDKVYKYKAKSPIDVSFMDIMAASNACESAIFSKEDVLKFDKNAKHLGNVPNDEYEETEFIISENRKLYGLDGVLLYLGSNIYDTYAFMTSNVTYNDLYKVIKEVETLTQSTVTIHYKDSDGKKEFKDLESYKGNNDIIDMKSTLIEGSSLEVKNEDPNARLQYGISIVVIGNEQFEGRSYPEVLPWHKNNKTLYNDIYIGLFAIA